MAKTANVPERVKNTNRRKYVRLTPDKVQLFADRLNGDRTLRVSNLCKEVGISRSTFYFVTSGTHRTTPEILTKIGHRLGIEPHEIFST